MSEFEIAGYDDPLDEYSVEEFIGIRFVQPARAGVRASTMQDFVFFLIVVALPSSFFGLVSSDFFYSRGLMDLTLISWLAVLPYLLAYRKAMPLVKSTPGGKTLVLVILFISLRFLATVLFGGSVASAFTVFRTFFTPISALAIVLYLVWLPTYRIVRFVNWIIVATTIQGFLFIIYYATGFNVFAGSVYYSQAFGNGVVQRYFSASPVFNEMAFSFSLLELLSSRNWKYGMSLLTCSVSAFLIATRSVIIVYAVIVVVTVLLYSRSHIGRSVNVFGLTAAGISLAFVVVLNLFPYQGEFLWHRFAKEGSVTQLSEATNYQFRLALVGQSLSAISGNDIFFGKGYHRDAQTGQYDYVLGGDTNIPGILYTEGVVGLFLRLLPFLAVGFYSLRRYRLDKGADAAIIVLALLAAEFLNVVQTDLFRNYTYLFPYLFMIAYMLKRPERYAVSPEEGLFEEVG